MSSEVGTIEVAGAVADPLVFAQSPFNRQIILRLPESPPLTYQFAMAESLLVNGYFGDPVELSDVSARLGVVKVLKIAYRYRSTLRPGVYVYEYDRWWVEG